MVRKSAPLAQQAADEILSGIRSGKLATGDGLLPSEAELSQRFGVSRATIREALAKLEHADVIVRKHGIGTFVAPPQPVIDAGLEELESLETLAKRIGLEARMSKATIEERVPLPAEADRLQLAPSDQILSVARVIMTGKRPVAYLVDIIPVQYLRQQDLGDSLRVHLDLFLQKQLFSAIRAPTLSPKLLMVIARKLRLNPGDILLKLEAAVRARGQSRRLLVELLRTRSFSFSRRAAHR
jgi:GntR family transcriptional regulator